jgi:hypothetical protein
MRKAVRRRRPLPVLAALGLVCLAVLVPMASGAPAPSVAFAPSSWDYGTVDANTIATKTFVLRNSGGASTGELAVSLTGSSAFGVTANTCTGRGLGPEKTCSVTVQYAPTGAGSTDNGTLTVSGKKAAGSASATLTGNGAGLRTVTVVFNVTVPASTDATGRSVYIAGAFDRLEPPGPPWDPGGVVLARLDATHWTITLAGTEGTQIEYKYTLGDWDRVEKGADCGELLQRQLTLSYGASGTQTVNDTVPNWRNVAPCAT